MEVKPYPKNAKKHPDKQLRQIADSIWEFGWQQPIVVDKDGVIIVGHGRWFAYEQYGKQMSLPEPWVKQADGLTPEQVKSYRLADNKLNESDWDMDLAIEDLKDLPDDLVELTGFDKDLLIEPDEKDDVVPDLPDEPTSKLGDIYQLGAHRVMCGDSTKSEDVEKLMDGKTADMVFTDPPYGLGGYAGRSGKFEGIKGDDIDVRVFYDAAYVTSNAQEKYIWGNWKVLRFFTEARWPNKILVWRKNNVGMGRGYRGQYELCLYWGKFRGQDSDVWDVARDVKYVHPTQKPVYLGERAMRNSSKQDDIVLDLFLGSGSTLIAAEKTGRTCYGMEIDPKYVDVIVKRWEEYTNQKAKHIT